MTKLVHKEKIELPLTSESEIYDLVEQFESCLLPLPNWTHRAHLAIALSYLRTFPLEVAVDLIRSKINIYNQTCGNPDGYNETVTILFMRRIHHEIRYNPTSEPIHTEVQRLEGICSINWIYEFYSKELIWSDRAKKEWLTPDIKPLSF